MQAVNVNSQSLLAKLLANEDISVQYKTGIKTAMFDLKNRVLMLPIWENISEDLQHLLLGHETGHALDTPEAETYRKSAEQIAKNIFGQNATPQQMGYIRGFLNVIEDARIDKRQKRRYPGLRKNYLLGYKELIERDFFGTANRDINSFNFIDRANLYCKGGSVNLDIEFTPEERKLLKRIEDAETFEQVVQLTEEVYLFCKNKNATLEDDLIISDIGMKDDSEGDEFDSDWEEVDGDDFDGEDEEGEGEGQEEDDTAEQNKGGGKVESDGGPEQNQDNTKGRASKGAGADAQVTDHAPESMTDKVWEEKVQSLAKDDDTDYVYLSFPEYSYKDAVHDYKRVLSEWRDAINRQNPSWNTYVLDKAAFEENRRHMMEWRQKEKDAISFLVKEFEQRKSAEIYSRISIAKTGVIDTNKLHSYRYNDDIFRRLSVLPEGKNHGFVMIIDWSGSMDCNLKETIKQLLTLTLFCRQIQVPFEVYLFKDSGGSCFPWIYNNGKQDQIGFGNIVLRQVLSSRMTTAELNEAMAVLWSIGHGRVVACDTLSGTPLNEAIALAPDVVNNFRKKYKLEIVNVIFLTDGESNALSGVKNESSPRNIKFRKKKYFYNDKDTGKTYNLQPYGGWGEYGISNTTTLLKILKDRTGCNLIGFYLWSESWSYFTSRFNVEGSADYLKKVVKHWKDNKFYPVKSEGYDEYYVIDARALKDDTNELVIDNSKSTKMMAKAFLKFANKKSVNRVLLRQFIEHVTSQAKKIA